MATRVALIAGIRQRLVELSKKVSDSRNDFDKNHPEPYYVSEEVLSCYKRQCDNFRKDVGEIMETAKYFFSPTPEIVKIFEDDFRMTRWDINSFENWVGYKHSRSIAKPTKETASGTLWFGSLHTPDRGYIRG